MRLLTQSLPLFSLCLAPSLWSVSCREEPVLQGIESPSLLSDRLSADEKLLETQENTYQKREGIYVDILYFGGRTWLDAQPVLLEQLGSLLEQVELPMRQGIRYQYEKGAIYVYEDQIYRMDIPLPEALRRSQALNLLGFPEQVDNYIITHREYILENEWEFRRLRMKRQSKDNELVTEVSAWKFSPLEN